MRTIHKEIKLYRFNELRKDRTWRSFVLVNVLEKLRRDKKLLENVALNHFEFTENGRIYNYGEDLKWDIM